MRTGITLSLALLVLLATALPAAAQLSQYKGDPLYRYEGIHSGNKVRTIFYNYGLVGNIGEISGEWPLGTGNEYVGDVTICVGVEYYHPANDTVRSVVTCKSPRGNDDLSPQGEHWGFEPLPGFGAPPLQGSDEAGKVAMSHLPETWPADWPDKTYTDPRDALWEADQSGDLGWPGKWNGYFGKDVTNADQESYWQMDDNRDREWNTRNLRDPETGDVVLDNEGRPTEVTYYPTSDDSTRGGMGLRVAARGFQWSHFLAEDAIIWQYEIANVSDYSYDKVVFGMIVGTLAGGRSDTQDDLAFFDPDNDITYSYDNNNGPSNTPGWVPVNDSHDVGWIGYAFLESPGNEFDGIDNDGDVSGSAPTLTASQLRTWTETGIYKQPGQRVVLIDYDTYTRTIVEMPGSGELTYIFRGEERTLTSSELLIEDGYNGFDDNFNGLIDERFVDPSDPTIDARLDHVGYAYIDYLSYSPGDTLKRGFITPGMDADTTFANLAPMIDESRDDGFDNDQDWDAETDDVGFDGQPSTGDRGEINGEPDNGEPNFDKTDIDESDQIGLTSFDYFDISGQERLFLRSDADMWRRLQPGVIDVVPGIPQDGDFIYGSGYFPLPSGNTQRFSTALFFGEDSTDVFLNKQTVQQIYDANYNFARPPEKPTVEVVPGDGYVTLYWDDVAEASFDNSQPVGDEMDFEGYKVYRATDPGFLENFVITDGLGRKVFHKPIAQFDLKNGRQGFFPGGDIGVSFYLGNDSGLQHVFTDSTVENGQTYYYAVTAYDFGNDSTGVFPAETSKFIFVDETGEVTTDKNTVVVVPSPKAAGYVAPVEGSATPLAGLSDGYINVRAVDPAAIVPDGEYHFVFEDEDELRRARRYSVYRMEENGDSLGIVVGRTLDDKKEVRSIYNLYEPSLDSLYGEGDGEWDMRSFYQIVETPVFDGLRAFMLTPRRPARFLSTLSEWDIAAPPTPEYPDSMIEFTLGRINFASAQFFGDSVAADYHVEFFDEPVDTSMYYRASFSLIFEEVPLYFKVRNLRTDEEPILLFRDNIGDTDGRVNDRSEILIMEQFDQDDDGLIDTVATWSINFRADSTDGKIYVPAPGDELVARTYKPFNSSDLFGFNSRAATINDDMVDMGRIKVYPNPYLAQNSQEPTNPYSSGRGERRITFNHLPDRCTIRIYTVRGELVKTIEHNDSIFDGNENWDLRNEDGLDIAYGIYVFHVDSEYGEHIGKFAVIK